MKKVNYYSLLFILFVTHLSFSQITVKGTILNNNKPVSGATILVKSTTNGTITDFDGKYTLTNVPEDATLIISYTGYSAIEINVDNYSEVNYDISTGQEIKNIGAIGSGSFSSNNYWIGAKIGYNFIGQTDDNFFVGSASIAMNVLEGLPSQHSIAIIGNFGNFKFDQETNDSENIQKVAQSLNGLSVGVGYTHELEKPYAVTPVSNLQFRQFVQTGVRLTSFKNVGIEEETVDLAQSVTTGGLEIELDGFKNDGSISFSTGVSLYLFDPSVFQKVFENDKKSLITLDFTMILPIAGNMGFFINGTFAKKTSANYILGVIFKS